MKKLLALVLALVMSMSLVTISNAAFKDADTIDNKEAVDVMNALGVLEGDENQNFNAKDNLTRAQAAKIICVMLLGKTAADGLNLKANFSDVSGWAESYIAYCASQGIVAGVGDGKFDPNGKLTGYQFAKMLLVALGYKADVEGMIGTDWQVNVAKLALNTGLSKDIDVALSNVITRDQAAKMAFNALTADMVKYSGGVNVSTGDGTKVTVDSTRSKVEGPSAAGDNYNNAVDNVMQFCEQYFPKLKKDTGVSTDDFNRPATKWSYNSKTVGTYANIKPMATWTTGIQDITEGDLYKALNFSSNGNVAIYENGVQNGTTDVNKGVSDKNLAGYKGATIEAYDTNDDGKGDELVISYPYLAQVTKVTEATKSADRKVTLKVWNSDDGAVITGVTYETEKFAKDDYVLVYAGDKMTATEAWNATSMTADILKVEAVETVSGKITSVSGTNGSAVTALTVNGTKYTLAGDKMATNGLNDNQLVKAANYSFKSETTLILANGYVIGVKGASAVGANIENIVYVTKAAYSSTDSYGETSYKVETVKLDGTVEIVENYGWYNSSTSARVPANTVYASATSAPSAIAAGFYTKDYDSATKSYKFTAVVGYASIDDDNKYGTTTLSATADMKADTKSVAVTGATKAYVTADSTLMFVDGTGSKLTVTVNNGPMKQNIASGSTVLVSKDKDNNYVVEALIVATKKVDVSAATVYVKSGATGSTADGTTYDMYDIATGEKTTIVSANASSVNGYVTYSVDADGVYTLTAVGAGAATNKDGKYALTDSVTKFGTTLSEGNLADCEAKDAVILNVTGSSDNDNLTLDDIAKATSLTAVALVKDEAVISIAVTAITKAV